MATIFTKIINGEIPCYKVAEDENHLAFLDIRPLKAGHVLAIPKKESAYIFDMEDEELKALMIFAKKVSKGIKAVIDCKKVGVAVIGLEVPHTHIHLIPIETVGDINFANPKIDLPTSQMEALRQSIAENITL